MGIELPAELAGIAEAIGVAWPEADEDALAEQAAAWRRAARELTTLAGDADASASRALDAVSGPVRESARRAWASLVDPDSGTVTEAVRGARQAADRLDHAAEQVGGAKVEIVRRLVQAARNRDAARVAAEAGHPAALLGLDTALRGIAADLGALTEKLAEAVGAGGGRDIVPGGEPVAAGPGVHCDHGREDLLRAVTGLPDAVAGLPDAMATRAPAPEGHPGGGLGGTGDTEGPSGADRAGEGPGGGHPGEVGDTLLPETPSGEVPPPGDPAGGEDTGPIAVSQVPTPPRGRPAGGPGVTELPTPPSGTPVPGGGPAPGTPPAAPAQTHLAGFTGAPGSGYPQAPAGPAAQQVGGQQYGPHQVAPQQYAPQQVGGHQYGSPSLAPRQVGAHYPGHRFGGQGAGAPHAAHSPPAPQGPPYGQGTRWGAPPAAQAPQGHSPWAASPRPPAPQPPAAPPQPAPPQPPAQAQPPPGSAPPPQPAAPAVPVGAPRQERESIVALFLVHMFPIGHLPVASDRPAVQLPAPPAEEDSAAVARFPPHDHPRSHEIDGERALAALRGGCRRPAPPPAEVLPCPPAALSEGHDPLGGEHERDWERRYLVRDGDPPEYAWPPPERYPEGGGAPGEPVTLAEGTLIDRFGTPHGRVFAADGTPFARRSLPPTHLRSGYRRYRVLRELPVWETVSAPWFGQPGGGVRYRSVYSAAELVTLGYLADITFEERA